MKELPLTTAILGAGIQISGAIINDAFVMVMGLIVCSISIWISSNKE